MCVCVCVCVCVCAAAVSNVVPCCVGCFTRPKRIHLTQPVSHIDSLELAHYRFLSLSRSLALSISLSIYLSISPSPAPSCDCDSTSVVRGNVNLSTLVFGSPMEDFFLDNAQYGKSACTSNCAGYEGNTYCEGEELTHHTEYPKRKPVYVHTHTHSLSCHSLVVQTRVCHPTALVSREAQSPLRVSV